MCASAVGYSQRRATQSGSGGIKLPQGLEHVRAADDHGLVVLGGERQAAYVHVHQLLLVD